jgi:hypothetical protein
MLPEPTSYVYRNKNGGTTRRFVNYNFQVCLKIKSVIEKKNTQQARGYAAETI